MRPRAGSARLPLYSPPGVPEKQHLAVRQPLDSVPEPYIPYPNSRSNSPRRLKHLSWSRWILHHLHWYRTVRWRFHRPRSIRAFVQVILSLAGLVILCFLWIWEPHVEVQVYSRNWVSQEVLPVEPLSGCFNHDRISPLYNYTAALAPKHHEVQAGMPLRMGMDCYDFAATIQPIPRHLRLDDPPTDRINFHTYWRADLLPFEDKQEWMIKSFFATQDLSASRLILWSNGDLLQQPRAKMWLQFWLLRYPEAFELRVLDLEAFARGTALEGRTDLLRSKDEKAWVDGDLVRLLVTWAYGGVWVDMDSLLSRDLSPLLEHEFVTQWDCYDKIYQPFNGALMHFRQHSPYLCEAFDIMSRSPKPRSGTTDWGSLLYLKLWRRLVAASIPPFKILPFCFSDARSCRLDNRLPDPFAKDKSTWVDGTSMEEGGGLDKALSKVFSVHLHNQWEKPFPKGGWVERLLLRRYEQVLFYAGHGRRHADDGGVEAPS